MVATNKLRVALESVQFMLEQDITDYGMDTLKRYVDRILKEDKKEQEDASSKV